MTRVPLESPLVWVAFATAAWEAGKEVLGSAKKRAERSSGEAAAGSSGSPLSRTASATLAPVTPRVPQGELRLAGRRVLWRLALGSGIGSEWGAIAQRLHKSSPLNRCPALPLCAEMARSKPQASSSSPAILR